VVLASRMEVRAVGRPRADAAQDAGMPGLASGGTRNLVAGFLSCSRISAGDGDREIGPGRGGLCYYGYVYFVLPIYTSISGFITPDRYSASKLGDTYTRYVRSSIRMLCHWALEISMDGC
jgi:hypothetical protein